MAEGKRRAAWSDAFSFGSDVIGQGFPSYGGGGFVQETQTVGDDPCASASSDFERGLCRLSHDPLGGTGKALGAVFGDPGGTLGKGIGTIADSVGGAAGAIGGAFWSAYGAKIIIGGLGAIFLIMGLVALTKGSGVGGEIAAGIKEGIANARSGS